MRRLILTGTTVLLLLAIAVGAAVAWLWSAYTRPGPLPVEKAVVIPSGMGVASIAAELTREGVIVDPKVFRMGVRVWDGDKPLRAGEYMFPARASAREAADVLQSGETVVRRLTLPEGRTVLEAVAQLRATDGLTGEIEELPDEGTLLPETYHFSHGDLRADMLQRMSAAMDSTLGRLWPLRSQRIPLETPEEALILASIVEKETGVAEERPLVAAVFLNRLEKGMRLQSDPTVVYGLTDGSGPLGRPLTRADLEKSTPYNTYLIDGLPPTPIANPGTAAIDAVLNPAQTDALYFVADGSGGHAFSKTLDEHNRNVRKWRRFLNEQRKEQGGQQ